MTGLSTRTRQLVLPASALAAAVGMTLVSQQACTVLSNDEPTCNECLFQQCTGEWAVCQQNADCMAIYTCSVQPSCVGSQPCVDACIAAHPAGAAELHTLTACDIAASCGACSASCTAICPDAAPAQDAATLDAFVADAAPALDGPSDAAPADADATPDDSGAMTDAGDDSSPPDASMDDSSAADATSVDAPAAVDAAMAIDSGGATSASTCTACVGASCAAGVSKCASSSACDSYAQCAAGCANAACVTTCGTTYPSGTSDEGALSMCVLATCRAACLY